MNQYLADVQAALKAAGFDPGPLDGVPGARTRAAVRAFQAANGLVVDSIAGPLTVKKLLGAVPLAITPQLHLPWLAEAERLKGLREVSGTADNPVIMDWAQDLDLDYAGDDVPWCGLFVAHCVAQTLPDEPLPANPLGARQWLKFGHDCPPQFGAVLVFWRGSPQGWTGHVGFYRAEDDATYHVLGGNQSDSVSITKIAKNRLLGARWPAAVPAPGLRLRADAGDLNLSTNEA